MSDGVHSTLSKENFPPFAFAFYRAVIDEAAELAVRSFVAFSRAVSDGDLSLETAVMLNQAVNHCATISRFLWPAKKGIAQYRGEQLRKLYDLDDNSPLNSRDLRNHLEHLDERIDDWLALDPVGPIIPGPVFADHSIVDEGFGHAFKVIDVKNEIYVVMGRKFEFAPLSVAVANVYASGDSKSAEKS